LESDGAVRDDAVKAGDKRAFLLTRFPVDAEKTM
jgi:hypothetical protein